MTTVERSVERLELLVETIPPLLKEINEERFAHKPSPGKWSKKEILGHLIDSATNNHQRFVRGQFESIPSIGYDQDSWNRFNHYNQIGAGQLIVFWTAYNTHLLEIIRRIPAERLARQVQVGANLLTLEFLIGDYVAHLEHHLQQITSYRI